MRRAAAMSRVLVRAATTAVPTHRMICTTAFLMQYGGGGYSRDGGRGGSSGRSNDFSRGRGGFGSGSPPSSQTRSGGDGYRQSNQSRGGGARRGEAARQPRDHFLDQNAQRLVELKRQHKAAKSGKERVNISQEARQLVRRTRIDPSTQDEKSVTILLNCAATFRSHPGSEGIEQAVTWMRRNIRGLSPQNLALFANAIGTLSVSDAEAILHDDVSPAVRDALKDMTPVEVVMVLQAFQRHRMYDNKELQEQMLQQLAPCVSSMPIPQLSTLASVLGPHPIKESHNEQWKAMVGDIMRKAMGDVGRMHSREAITFLDAAAQLDMPQDVVVQLVERATATCGFHTEEQVAQLLHALGVLRKKYSEPTEELSAACNALAKALVIRLERVAEYATLRTVSAIWRGADAACAIQLPLSTQEKLLVAAKNNLIYSSRHRIGKLAMFAKSATQQLPQPLLEEILVMIADYLVGKRPSRSRSSESEDAPGEVQSHRQGLSRSFFADMVLARLYLESAMEKNGTTVPESLSQTIPSMLLAGAEEATPRQLLSAAINICQAPACGLRNTANDEALLQIVLERMRPNPVAFRDTLSPPFIKVVTTEIASGHPKTAAILELLDVERQKN